MLFMLKEICIEYIVGGEGESFRRLRRIRRLKINFFLPPLALNEKTMSGGDRLPG